MHTAPWREDQRLYQQLFWFLYGVLCIFAEVITSEEDGQE